MPRRTKPRKRTKKVGAQVASKSSESKGDDRSEIPGEAAAAALLTRIASGTTQCESRQAEVAAGSLYHAMLGVGAAIKAKEITLRKRDFIRAVAAKKVAILAAGGVWDRTVAELFNTVRHTGYCRVVRVVSRWWRTT